MIPPPLFPNKDGVYPYSMDPKVINEILPVLLPDIARVAGNKITAVIDIQSAILASPLARPNSTDYLQLQCDGCHPTDAANQIIAETMAPYILKVQL